MENSAWIISGHVNGYTFDKYLRSCQREYRKRKIDDIEYACIDYPRKFWDHIKRIGPKKKPCIPEVVRTTDRLSTDTNVILRGVENYI